MLIIETLYLDLHIINSETNLTTMKKQEMINVIMLEEQQLWKDAMNCKETFGEAHQITQDALRRWGAVCELVKKLGL